MRLFANDCNSIFKKIIQTLGQTLTHKNNLLHLDDTRESPSFQWFYKKNQRLKQSLEIAHLFTTSKSPQILLQTFANENKIHITHCNASKARQRVIHPERLKHKQIWGFINLLRRRL
jgi:hypothetical protein